MNRLAARLIAVLVMILSFAVLAPAAEATFPGKNGKIAYRESSVDAPTVAERNNLVVAIDPDGTGRIVLADRSSGYGRWSPDGSRIVFNSGLLLDCCHAPESVEVVNADGTGFVQVAGYEFGTGTPSWSPDGTKLIWDENHRDYGDVLFTSNPDGTGLAPITEVAPGGGPAPSYSDATWSPDSQRLVTSRDGAITIMNRDGTDKHAITDNSFRVDPLWSPRGDKIAFLRNTCAPPCYAPNDNVFTINPDGSGLRQLTHFSDASVETLAWSPEGGRLAFGLRREYTTSDIYTLNSDGSALTNVTRTGHAAAPVWSPDGRRIVFASYSCVRSDFEINCENFHDLYTIKTDGTDMALVTTSANSLYPTDWQPIPGPKRSDYKNATEFCKAEQVFWGDQFSQRYRNFGQCVSGS
jgi:Tol biopolymer transport system component